MLAPADLRHLKTRPHGHPRRAAALLTAIAGVATAVGPDSVTRFVLAGLALAALAALVGQAIEQVGERLGPGATGLLQSTLGNLPELFVGLFALRDGLTAVVQAALVGSVLGNAVLVLGWPSWPAASATASSASTPRNPASTPPCCCWWWPPCWSRPSPTTCTPRPPPTSRRSRTRAPSSCSRLRRQRPVLPSPTGHGRRPGRRRRPEATAATQNRAWPLAALGRRPGPRQPRRRPGIGLVRGPAPSRPPRPRPVADLHRPGRGRHRLQRRRARRRHPLRPQGQAGVRHQHHAQQPAAGGAAAHPGPGAAQPGRRADPAHPGLPAAVVAALACRRSWWR